MGPPFAPSLRALIRPGAAFDGPPPGLGKAVLDMALVWMPLALMNAVWTAVRGLRAYEALRSGGLPSGLPGWLGVES